MGAFIAPSSELEIQRKNMKQMKEITFKDRSAIFGRLEEIASRANLSKEERAQYEYEWKVYNDYFNTLDYAEKKGREEGIAEGLEKGREEEKLENARKFKALGVSTEIIMQATGLSSEEIEGL